jgi:hypothetical protein
MRRELVIAVGLLGVLLLVNGIGTSEAQKSTIAAGRYRGHVACIGSDRFSNGASTRHYHSTPIVSVTFGSGGRLKRWTYLFLGRHNLAVQSRAVRRGQGFSYAAGAHIGRPGRTRVTIDQLVRTAGSVEVLARLDWSSPTFDYVGAGTYDLTLERVGRSIRYEAVKVVVKLPQAGVSAANPIIRRHERCVGLLSL